VASRWGVSIQASRVLRFEEPQGLVPSRYLRSEVGFVNSDLIKEGIKLLVFPLSFVSIRALLPCLSRAIVKSPRTSNFTTVQEKIRMPEQAVDRLVNIALLAG